MRRILLFLLTALTGLGCATQKATINTYVDPSFTSGSVQGIAVFPVRNTRMAPSEAMQMNRKISMALHQQNPGIHILGSAEASRILNEHGLADEWAVFLDNYVTSGIPDAVILATVGDVLGVDAILQGEVVNVFQEDGRYGVNAGQTRVTVRFTLLGVAPGKLLWESSSDGIRGTATTLGSAPPIIEAINLAVDKIMGSLPTL